MHYTETITISFLFLFKTIKRTNYCCALETITFIVYLSSNRFTKYRFKVDFPTFFPPTVTVTG